MKKHTWKEKFQYHFDNMMSKGTISLIGILFGITFTVVAAAGIILAAAGKGSVGKGMWLSLMHAIDAGTLTADEGSWQFLLLMTVVTICGLFITSMLIGIINAGLADKMTSLQKGKSLVLEKNHTVILGFNENALNILSELVLANENHRHCVVVIMDDVDKTKMEDAIHHRIPDTKTTKIICRSGQIDHFADLSICSLETCRSVILNVDDDARTVKAILACVHLLEKSDNQKAYVTAMIHNLRNYEAAQIAGRGRAEILYFKQTIARLMAHTSRQPGISAVFTNLLSYDGDEIYVEAVKGSEGLTLSELNLRLPESIVIGISGKDICQINPPADTVVRPGDELILIEEDDGVSVLEEKSAEIAVSAILPVHETKEEAQRSLILGNSDLLELVLQELDHYVQPGTIVVAANRKQQGQQKHLELKNIHLEQRTCDIYSREVLTELLMEKPDNVMLLADSAAEDEVSDAATLMLLLQISDIAEKNRLDFTVASEMCRVENQELAKMTKANDFVVSSSITARMMTQISQNRKQRLFLEDLLDENGSEFYRKPISRYIQCGVLVDFYTISAAAAQYGEIAVGYQTIQDGRFHTVCNPNKADRIVFSPGDALIVIAED